MIRSWQVAILKRSRRSRNFSNRTLRWQTLAPSISFLRSRYGRTQQGSSSHRRSTAKILKRFNMDNCKVAMSPMEMRLKFSVHDDVSSTMDASLYRRLVGNLHYLTNTWPDISYLVGVLCQFLAKPRHIHWEAWLIVLWYLNLQGGAFLHHYHPRSYTISFSS